MFNFSGMQFNRGTLNSQASPLSTVMHAYISFEDVLADIATFGYIPPFGGSSASDELVNAGDTITLVGTDSFAIYRIINPATFSLQNITVPAASNIFPSGIFTPSVEPLAFNTSLVIGGTMSGTLVLGNPTNISEVPGTLRVTNVESTANFVDILMGTAFDMKIQIGKDDGSATTGLLTNKIDQITTAFPLQIGRDSQDRVELGNSTTPTLANGGIVFTLGNTGTLLQTFDSVNGDVTYTGPWGANQLANLSLQKVNNVVYLSGKGVTPTAAANAIIITAPAAIPVFARPVTTKTGYFLMAQSNSVNVAGVISVLTNGDITVAAGLNGDTFANTGNAGFFDYNISYNVLV